MDQGLSGKTALVTGAGGGVGARIATDLAAAGVRVFLGDVDHDRCEALASEIGHQAVALTFDVTDRSSIDAALSQVLAISDRIDMLINCAGVYSMQFLDGVTEAEFDRLIAINLKGLLFTTQAVVRVMVARAAGGVIVNVASAAARRASAGSMVYSASKAGVIAVTQAAAQELAAVKIRVNAIAPGAVETPMWDAVKSAYGASLPHGAATIESMQLNATPAGRLCTPQDCADAVLFLCSDRAGFITGQTLNVDGGLYMN